MKKIREHFFKISVLLMSLIFLITAVLTVYFGIVYIKISYEISKAKPLDVCDKVIITSMSMILCLAVFRAIYLVFLKLKHWE